MKVLLLTSVVAGLMVVNVVCLNTNLPSTPFAHLTPPKQQTAAENHSKLNNKLTAERANQTFTQRVGKWLWTTTDVKNNVAADSQRKGKEQPRQQTASSSDVSSLYLVAPSVPILAGKQIAATDDDCNPCNRVPWMPVSRNSEGRYLQYALTIPTIHVAIPVKTIPNNQPPLQYGPPPPPSPTDRPFLDQIPTSINSDSAFHSINQGTTHSDYTKHGNQPPTQYLPPSEQYGPPIHPPEEQYGPPNPQPGEQYGPPNPPPGEQYGPPNPQPGEYGPPNPQPGEQYGPPNPQPGEQYGPPNPLPGEQYGPPPSTEYGPPPNDHYETPILPPSTDTPRLPLSTHFNNIHTPSTKYTPPPLSPPPPPPAKYGPPRNQPPIKYGPPNNFPPPKYIPPSSPPPLHYGPPNSPPPFHYGPPVIPPFSKYAPPINTQALPPVKYGPPFNPNLQPGYSSGLISQPLKHLLPTYNLPSIQHDEGAEQHSHHYQTSASLKAPVIITNPIPFPEMSKALIPPLFNYHAFGSGKHHQFLNEYLQPPEQSQNVISTVNENKPSSDDCSKCLYLQQQNQLHVDSEPTSTMHAITTEQHNVTTFNGDTKTQFEITKSIPLAEYLASVEYPMQIIQAPILDVPDLQKYFNMGSNNFPSELLQKIYEQQLSQAHFSHPQNNNNALHVNTGLQKDVLEPTPPSSLSSAVATNSLTTDVDNLPSGSDNKLPENHKDNFDSPGKGQGYEKQKLESESVHFIPTSTQRPGQVFHVSGEQSTVVSPTENPVKTTVDITPSIETYLTSLSPSYSSHYVTAFPPSQSIINGHSFPQASTFSTNPSFSDFYSTEQSKTGFQFSGGIKPEGFTKTVTPDSFNFSGDTVLNLNNSPTSNLRFLNPPPFTETPNADWLEHLYQPNVWGMVPPRPFNTPVTTTQAPRFITRPAPVQGKKSKHIEQIIVPYTSSKETQESYNKELHSEIEWTPLPPVNQGRKVPSFGEKLPASEHPFGVNTKSVTANKFGNVPLSATGSDQYEQQFSTSTAQDNNNLPPSLMSHILKLGNKESLSKLNADQINSGDLQQIIAQNLQALLKGEEDSIDFVRLQKNIDNWTAEGYKQNSPSEIFPPITSITHLLPSKQIPEEYLTTTQHSISSSTKDDNIYHTTSAPYDYEVSASQNHLIKTFSEPHIKYTPETAKENDTDSIVHEVNGWSLLDTKIRTFNETSRATSSSTTTMKPWEKIQVSISPLTKEKVYVVTPQAASYRDDDTESPVTRSSVSMKSTRIERSYSVVTSGRNPQVLQLPEKGKEYSSAVNSHSARNTTNAASDTLFKQDINTDKTINYSTQDDKNFQSGNSMNKQNQTVSEQSDEESTQPAEDMKLSQDEVKQTDNVKLQEHETRMSEKEIKVPASLVENPRTINQLAETASEHENENRKAAENEKTEPLQEHRDSWRLNRSQQQQHADDYYHSFPDVVQSDELLIAQEDIDSIRSAVLELKKERKVS